MKKGEKIKKGKEKQRTEKEQKIKGRGKKR